MPNRQWIWFWGGGNKITSAGVVTRRGLKIGCGHKHRAFMDFAPVPRYVSGAFVINLSVVLYKTGPRRARVCTWYAIRFWEQGGIGM